MRFPSDYWMADKCLQVHHKHIICRRMSYEPGDEYSREKKWMKIPSNLLVFQDKIKLTAVPLFSAS